MSNTKLRSKLPGGDANGLAGDAWRKKLVAQPRKPRVGIVIFDVDSITTTLDTNEEVPAVRLLAVEPVEDALEQSVLVDQLRRSQAARTGQTTLDGVDFPAPEKPTDVWKGPEAIEAPDLPRFEVRPLPGGKAGLYMVSATGAELGKRGGLHPSAYGIGENMWDFGNYYLEELPSSLRAIANVLLNEWRAANGEPVDAEVVEDDEPEPPTDAEWDDNGSDFEGGEEEK